VPSLWLNSGVPATEVAERLGHSVDVLLKIYAKCIDGQRDLINKRISDGLGDVARPAGSHRRRASDDLRGPRRVPARSLSSRCREIREYGA
jgi:hypothetical protein